jgi:hypothetical protein
VSICCSVVAEPSTGWWLTVESGRVPVCDDPAVCGCDGMEPSAGERRRAYMVVNGGCACGQWNEVAFAPLCKESLGVVRKKVLPAMCRVRCAPRGAVCNALKPLFLWMARGKTGRPVPRSTSTGAAGEGSGAAKQITGGTFYWCNAYMGTFPRGTGDWFAGVSDAVGAVRGAEWSQCMLRSLKML